MNLKTKLANNVLTIGSWITLAHPAIAEIMAKSGFDWLVVDLEHSVISVSEAENLIRVIELCGVAPLVRLSANDPVQIKRMMDAGAHGIIIPMVNSATEAEQAVAAVRYPPHGIRGVGLARAQGYGTTFEPYLKWVNRESVVVVQVEHIDAVHNLESILSVDGVDGFIVGPYDLSGSLGIPGDFESRKMLDALERIMTISSKYDLHPGYHVVPPEPSLVKQKIGEGYKFIAYGVDFNFLGEMCRRGLREIKAF